MTDSTQPVRYCVECSLEVGEPLFATAPRTDVWLMLEYNGAWGAQALPDSDLPQSIKDHIGGWLKALPTAKFCFIKRDKTTAGVAFFVALSRESDPALYKFTLDSVDALLTLDIDAVVRGDPAYAAHRTDEPLFAICTNGKRDISCSKYGLKVYHEIARMAGESAWQTTHIGGHRFAATFACLPDGLVYGYVDPADAEKVVEEFRHKRVVLDKARGMAYYDEVVQAADYFLRQQTGLRDVPGVCLAGVEPMGDSAWTVRLQTLADGVTHEVRVERFLSEWKTYQNSGDPAPKHMPQFRLVGIM